MKSLKSTRQAYYVLQEHISIVKRITFLGNAQSFQKTLNRLHSFVRWCSGLPVACQMSLACQKLNIKTNLEAVAMRVIIFGRLTAICSTYIGPDYHLTTKEFESLLNQLPAPFFLVVDLMLTSRSVVHHGPSLEADC